MYPASRGGRGRPGILTVPLVLQAPDEIFPREGNSTPRMDHVINIKRRHGDGGEKARRRWRQEETAAATAADGSDGHGIEETNWGIFLF